NKISISREIGFKAQGAADSSITTYHELKASCQNAIRIGLSRATVGFEWIVFCFPSVCLAVCKRDTVLVYSSHNQNHSIRQKSRGMARPDRVERSDVPESSSLCVKHEADA
ncbi:hypothetical protein BC936DRAFT_136579, partial [Jimgerdemannia flammicorona]